jgi:hypothetical protein
MRDITKLLRESHTNFDIQFLGTEPHAPLTNSNEVNEQVYKSTVLVQIFEKSDRTDLKPQESMTLLKKAQATAFSINHPHLAEDCALIRALSTLGLASEEDLKLVSDSEKLYTKAFDK